MDDSMYHLLESGPSTSTGEDEAQHSLLTEWLDLLKLSLPIFVSYVSWVGMKTTDTAILGHVGTEYLSAAALSDLYTSSSGVMIEGSVLTIFASQAIGAGNKKLAGVWLQVSLTLLTLLAIPVIALWTLGTYPVLRALGEEHQLASRAAYYAGTLALCIPARIGFKQLVQYFQSQRIMRPSVITSCIAMCLNLVLGLVLVLGQPFPRILHAFGFPACPLVTCFAEYVQLLVLVGYFCLWKKLHQECWPGWSRAEVTGARLRTFAGIYLPAALSVASDFWRMSAIGAMARLMGPTHLAVFNASYRVLWMCLVFVGSIASAVSIKLGTAFGTGQAARAVHVTRAGLGLCAVLLCGLALLVLLLPRQLGSIFSSDPTVLDMFQEIRLPLAWMMVVMNLSVAVEKVPLCMGRSKAVLGMGLIGSWGGQVPAVLLLTRYWRNDLIGLYSGCALGYTLLVGLYGSLVITADWQRQAEEARIRSEVPSTA